MLYNQTIELVEVTKLLERVPVDTMTFQNSLGHNYVDSAINIIPQAVNYPLPVDPDTPAATFQFGVYNNDQETPSNIYETAYKSLAAINSSLSVKALCFFGVYNYGEAGQKCEEVYSTQIVIKSPSGTTTTISTNNTSNDGSQLGTISLNAGGTWEIIYSVTAVETMIPTATYSIYVLNNTQPSIPYTIATVIERILNAGLGNLNGNYILDPDLYDMLNAIPAPEFCITRKNLYEALLEIGGYGQVQGLPVLKQDTSGNFKIISYDLLTNMSEWMPSSQVDLDKYIDYESSQDAESYCGGIEIYADNLVDNSVGGSVEQPFPQTVRTESADLVINDNAAIIPTEFPIWSVQSVTQAFVADGQYVGDITPHIFEKSLYDNLTSYKGDFPYAKQFAFYYIQGQPNLYGLTLKAETATNIDAAVADFAAVAIAERKGKDYNSSNGIACFAYKVNYTPITSRRLRQYKVNLADQFPTSNVLFFNPSTNIADAKNLGEHAAAQLQKIGNQVRILTYKIYNVADLPRKGMRIGDEIITEVDYAFDVTYIKATIHLTKYNRLSEYIGINSQKRFYEVSEKQSVQRALNYSFVATVGNNEPNTYRVPAVKINEKTVQYFAETFNPIQAASFVTKVMCVIATAYDKEGNPIEAPTLHTVSSNGFGKSSAFYFNYADNYSAGNQAVYCSYKLSSKAAQKLQRAVRYADMIGRFYSLKMDYYTRLQVVAADNFTYSDQVTTSIKQAFCDKLPEIDPSIFSSLSSEFNVPIFSLTKVVDKNGGEQISVDTQIHFVALNNDYIIGNALGARNSLTVGYQDSAKTYTPVFVCLPYQLSYNQEAIPIAHIQQFKVSAPGFSYYYDKSIIGLVRAYVQINGVNNTTGQKAKSWAVVHEEDGAILIGQNISIEEGAAVNNTYIDFNIRPL